MNKEIVLHIPPEHRPFDGPEVLIYHDGPLIFWLPYQDLKLLAIGLPDDAGHFPFLVIEVSDEEAQALENNTRKLKSACISAKNFWLLENYDEIPSLTLKPITEIPENWMPGDVTLYLEE